MVFKCYARPKCYIRTTEGDTLGFLAFLLWLVSTDMEKNFKT